MKKSSYYWSTNERCHPKNRLLKYSKSSKISSQTLQMLLKIRHMYEKIPPIIYCLQNNDDANEDCKLEYDIFGQHCSLTFNNIKTVWQPTSFSVSDRIYEQIKRDLHSYKIDKDYAFLCLFPIYSQMNRKKQLLVGQQSDEIFLPATTPSTQCDLINLVERFDEMLQKEQALEIGICEKRRRIYSDFLDELIRIISLECTERGVLLARIRNEYIQWITAYEELYSSSMAYGIRQYLCKMKEKQKYERTVCELENECQQLQKQIDQESIRLEKVTKLLQNDDEENHQRYVLKSNLNIVRSTNEILRRDVRNSLNNIMSSTIFLGEPIDYNKEND